MLKIDSMLKYKIRCIYLILIYGSLLLISLILMFTHARYESSIELSAKLDAAQYIIDEGNFKFNIETDKIIPREEPYVYNFYLANYNNTEESEVDMEYSIAIKTTTNMPLRYELYRNESHTDTGAVNILGARQLIQDEDDSWYNYFEVSNSYNLLYTNKQLDTYYLVIYFDTIYKNNLEYSDKMDSIQVIVNAKQVI